ncbi:MAG: IspD/TarI family cytidylyltransferase [Clostridiales bacterium]|nr:IspD/TarI family cytidylyltransferase [Clostridiales bacterium]
MNFGLILAGGVGTRMGQSIPKQYLIVEGKPVLVHTLEHFQECELIDRIVIVADAAWRTDIRCWLSRYGITKFLDFADPGESRQKSVFSGLTCCKKYAAGPGDIVAIHDAARALTPTKQITELIKGVEGYDGCLPVLPMKDAIFFSETGDIIDSLTDRSKLFCAQSPECFRLLASWEINNSTPPEELDRTMANWELAFRHNWRIHLHPGDENSFKLTTPGDIDRMISLLRAGKA